MMIDEWEKNRRRINKEKVEFIYQKVLKERTHRVDRCKCYTMGGWRYWTITLCDCVGFPSHYITLRG